MFIVTVPPMIRSSSVGAAWSSPRLTMPPRWGLRRFCLGAGTINMSLLRSWPLSSRRPLPPRLAVVRRQFGILTSEAASPAASTGHL
jgi:hypothetical protein